MIFQGHAQDRCIAGYAGPAVISCPSSPRDGRVIGSRIAPSIATRRRTARGSPALTLHTYGKGIAVWLAAPFEASAEQANRQLILNLLGHSLPGPYAFQADTHPAVEVTLFNQPDRRQLLVGLLNMQRQLPQVPVPATVRVKVPAGGEVKSVTHVPDSIAVPFTRLSDYVQFDVAPFEGVAMFVCQLG